MSLTPIETMLAKVKEEYETSGAYKTLADCLNAHIRKNKYFPMIQTKKIFASDGLVLMHNTYVRDDVEHFKELYESIRSVVIDTNASNIVVSLADKIPTRMSVEDYLSHQHIDDTFEKAYKGTMIYVYSHKEVWHFGTSTCPSIDNSKFFHPTKTHGQMFDEVLTKYFPEDIGDVREKFCSYLSPEKAYGFLLVHHENCHLMDYSGEFGSEYGVLFHIFTREKRGVLKFDDKLSETGVLYAQKIPKEDFADTVYNPTTYAVMVHRGDEVFKVSRIEVIQCESKDRGNSNIWVNMLSVYMQCKPDYKIENYIDEFMPHIKHSLTIGDALGNNYSPTFVIHEVMRTMTDTLYSLYRATTHYNKTTKRYTINRELEGTIAPIIRFHLAQLRNIQITTHTHAPITHMTIRHYLCLHQTIKNIRMLISYFSTAIVTNTTTYYPYQTVSCFLLLTTLLAQH